jgi:hypothetical protein
VLAKRITLQVGDRTIMLVAGTDIEQWGEERARRQLREIASAWPGRDALLRLSDRTLGPSEDIDAAIEHLVREMARGELVAMRIDDLAGMRSVGVAADDWDAPRLADLRREVPAVRSDTIRRAPGSTRQTDPPVPDDAFDRGSDRPTDTWTTFVAFAVVDQHGAPLGGESRCTISGKTHTYALGDTRIEITPIAAHADVRLELHALKQRAAGA